MGNLCCKLSSHKRNSEAKSDCSQEDIVLQSPTITQHTEPETVSNHEPFNEIRNSDENIGGHEHSNIDFSAQIEDSNDVEQPTNTGVCCDFCQSDVIKLQMLDLSLNQTIELDVIPESTEEPRTSEELKKIAKRLKPKKEFTHKEKKLRKIMKDLIVLLGNGVIAKTIPEAVAKLLVRNYPKLVESDGTGKIVIFVPDYYLSSLKMARYIDPSRGPELEASAKKAAELYPERKKEFEAHEKVFSGGIRSHRGEIPEMKLYNTLKKRSEESSETMAIFHSLDIMKFDLEKQENKFTEKDFVVVNATHGYIMPIEVKKTLNETTARESLEQLEGVREDLQTYLTSDILKDEFISQDWMFLPMIYCKQEEAVFCCDHCRQHIITGTI